MTIEDMRQGVSKIRDHVIARVFRELGLIEQWGSGVPRMFSEAEENGLPEPQIVEIGMRLRFVIPLAQPLDTNMQALRSSSGRLAQPGPGAQSDAVLLAMSDTPLSSAELMQILGLETKTGAFKGTIQGLLKHALIEYTLPDKPNSRLQKYRLTQKGRTFLSKGVSAGSDS